MDNEQQRGVAGFHRQAQDTQQRMLMLMVEMRTELGAIRELVTTQGRHTNQRIDDLQKALDARLQAQEKDIDDLNQSVGRIALKSAGTGGLAGGVTAIAVELVKQLIQGG